MTTPPPIPKIPERTPATIPIISRRVGDTLGMKGLPIRGEGCRSRVQPDSLLPRDGRIKPRRAGRSPAGVPRLAGDPVDEDLAPVQLRLSLEALADPLGDADRGGVVGMDDAD